MNTVAGLGKKSRTKLANLLREAKGTISVDQAAKSFNLPPKDAAKILARWANQGWLSRVRRGLYVPVPLEARTGDVALEDSWIVAERLFSPCYVGGWSAAEHWGLTEQIFRSVFVVSAANVRSRAVQLLGVEFRVAHTSKDQVARSDSGWRGREELLVSGRELTLADSFA